MTHWCSSSSMLDMVVFLFVSMFSMVMATMASAIPSFCLLHRSTGSQITVDGRLLRIRKIKL